MASRPLKPSAEDWRAALAEIRAKEEGTRFDATAVVDLDIDDLPDQDQLGGDPLEFEWEAVSASIDSSAKKSNIWLSNADFRTLHDDFISKRRMGSEIQECLSHYDALISRIAKIRPRKRERGPEVSDRVFAHRYEDEYGLTTAERQLLDVLAREGSLSANAVASHLDMDKVRVSRAVARAVNAGLVRRTEDRRDRRRSVLTLTADGWAIHNRIVPSVLELEAEPLSGIENKEVSVLQGGAARRQERAGRMVGQAPDEES